MLYGTEYMKPNSHNGSVFISLLKIQNTVVEYKYSYKYADCQITFKMSQEKQHTSVAYSLEMKTVYARKTCIYSHRSLYRILIGTCIRPPQRSWFSQTIEGNF